MKKQCGNCRFFKEIENDRCGEAGKYRVGECVDAVERARKVVPFAVNLDVSKVYAHGGVDCPCFEPM